MGFKTSVATNLTPLVATARVTLSINQLEAVKDNLLIIEKIQDVRSNIGTKDKTDEGFAKLVKERVFKGRDKILLESVIDGNKKEISSLEELIDFMMKEIEYLEDMGNISLASSFRSNLYSSLNYNASTVRVQVGGTFFGKRMTENGNFFFSFLGKLGIVSDDDIKRAIDLIESSKELRSEIIAAEEELVEASKKLSEEMRKNLPNSNELIEAAEIDYQEKLNKLQELERKAETISISELDLQKARDGLSKAGKGLRFAKFLGNFSIACINPLNSMEFAALGLAIDAGSTLTFKLVPAVYKLIFNKIFRDKLFDKTKSYIEILRGLGDNSLLDEEIIGFAPEESKTNKYLRSVEEKTIESRKTGSASRRVIRDAQSAAMEPKATTFKWTKNSSKEYEVIFSKQMKKLMSGRIAATIKAALKVVGKILAKVFIALYAKSLWDNVTGDQVEVGIVYPGEISHNISQAFTKMKDHTFKSYSCEEKGECDSTIFNENHKFDLGGSDSSLYSKILRSDGIGEIKGYIEKIRSCKQSLRSIVEETLTEENINRNLNINFDLATDAMFASVEETTTLLAEVLPMLLSSAAEENIRFCSRYYTGENPGDTITQEVAGFISYYITYVPLKIIGLILSFANAVDVISHAIMYPDKLKPCKTAFDKESLEVFDSMIEEICLSLESTCIYKFLKANSTLDIHSRDPALTDILSKYDLAFSGDYLE